MGGWLRSWWPFVLKTTHREVQLKALDRGSRLNEAHKLIRGQAEELSKLKMALAALKRADGERA